MTNVAILTGVTEVVMMMSDLAHSEGVLVPGPANVERIIAVVVSSLDSSSGDVTWGAGRGFILGPNTPALFLPLEASTQARSQFRGATRI